MKYQVLLKQIVQQYQHILGENLVGIYLHGSAAFRCDTQESDIDFIVVVKREISQKQKEDLIRLLLDLSPNAPQKGFEMSVVLLDDCLHFQCPTPYQLHFSIAHQKQYQDNLSVYSQKMQGVDFDLAAHFTVIQRVGIVLWGDPICSVFSSVPWEYYLDSIYRDVEDAPQQLTEDTVSVILNLCRVWAAYQEKMVCSKLQGGEWALSRIPQMYQGNLRKILCAYRDGNKAEIYLSDSFRALAELLLEQICKVRAQIPY